MARRTFRVFQADAPEARVDVVEAIETIVDRVEAKQTSTAIVLPPRTGKSTVIRLSAIELQTCNLASCCVVLTPWTFLSGQLNKPKLVEDMADFYGMRNATKPLGPIWSDKLVAGADPHFYETRPLRMWWTCTMAQAYQADTRKILCDAAAFLKTTIGLPMVVFVDESHLLRSDAKDGWGALVNDLRNAGASIVLLTGTPYRSDNVSPYGFDVVELTREEVEYWSPSPDQTGIDENQIRMEQRSAEKVKYKLIAHYELPCDAAFRKGYVCYIDRRFFDFRADGEKLRVVTDGKARRSLAVALRDPEVIKVAAEVACEELHFRRETDPTTAMIVYVGNDREGEEKDFHCRQAKRIIDQVWRKRLGTVPDIRIATLGDDQGKAGGRTVEGFIAGRGDVLIVKQMGGVGLDCQRLKVALDLSSVRTLANTMQRWFRVATKWGKISHGTLILPDDAVSKELFKNIVDNQGGRPEHMENSTVLDTEVFDMNEDVPPDILITDPGRAGAEDQWFHPVDIVQDVEVDAAIVKMPILASRLTRAEVLEFLSNARHRAANPQEEVPAPRAYDASHEVDRRHKYINDLCKELTNRAASYGGGQDDVWIQTFKAYIIQAKRGAQIKGNLKHCRDLDKLDAAIKFLEEQLKYAAA